jgi:hypothetical protein
MIVRMRGGDDVLNPVLQRHAAHGFRYFPRLGPVIYFGQDVAVNVNHEGRLEQIRNKSPNDPSQFEVASMGLSAPS